jgi:hypothetical protein
MERANEISDKEVIFDSKLRSDSHIYSKINKEYSMLGLAKEILKIYPYLHL